MRQERVYRTEAIVLREMDYGEADRILTLLTPKGKLSAMAKGVRRPTSRKVGHLGLFMRAQLMLAKGRNLDIITQAESVEAFEGIRGDLLRFTYACYVEELIERFAQEEDEDTSQLYDLMITTLRWLAEDEDLQLGIRHFELRLLTYVGYQPQFFSCLHCRKTIQPVPNYFSATEGGLLCEACKGHDASAQAVSVNAQKVLRYLQTHSLADVRALRVGPATHAEVEALLYAYLEYILERELKSVIFLERLRNELRAVSAPGTAAPDMSASQPADGAADTDTLGADHA